MVIAIVEAHILPCISSVGLSEPFLSMVDQQCISTHQSMQNMGLQRRLDLFVGYWTKQLAS